MIPLFKSQFSIGKSILTPQKILDICQLNSLQRVVIVEDSMYGFRVMNKLFSENNIQLIFGLSLPTVQNDQDKNEKPSKIIYFAKNNDGLKKIKSLYTDANMGDRQCVYLNKYSKKDFSNIEVSIPFYDSYIYNNIFHFGLSDLTIDHLNPTYFIEDNNHPFDFQIQDVINSLNVKKQQVKSIYYHNKDDFHAFQMYKAVCVRSQGKSPTFSNPNLNHFCSDEFCWEAYKDATV